MKNKKNIIFAFIALTIFGFFINTNHVNAENNYRISLDFNNKLEATILSVRVNDETWNDKNDIFYSDDDTYNISITYSNPTGANPGILYDDAWKGKITTSNFCIKGCNYNITVNNTNHNENIAITFTGGHTINFETNGGSSIDSTFVETNSKPSKPANPTKDGYVFDDWYQEETLSIPFSFNNAITNDITLYAKWIKEYDITVTSNDEQMGIVSSNIQKGIEGTFVELTAESKEGYHFVNWSSQDVDASTGEFSMPNKNVSIVAIFEKNTTYSIKFEANGGIGTMEDITELEEGMYTLPDNDFVPSLGKQFKGWSLSTDGELITELEMNENKIVYAIWEDIPYTYNFLEGDNQELKINEFTEFTFRIDGHYMLFESLKIGNLDLIMYEDYEVTEGSTIITFTDNGLAKLNTLSKGEYEIIVTYSNGEEAIGKLILTANNDNNNSNNNNNNNKEENPKTIDNITLYLIIGFLSIISLTGCSLSLKHKKIN